MSEEFDPYRKWLGIPPKDQPPHHYRLLGIATFEDDPDVIENAASRQMSHVRTFQSGKHSALSQRILNELTSAKLCLLQPPKKTKYDTVLRQHLEATGQLSSEGPLDAAVEKGGEELPPPPPADFRGSEGRWRTGAEVETSSTSQGPVPVPIPMPPAAPPPIGAVSLMTAPNIRRTSHANSGSRGRKHGSSLPLMLILGSVGLLAVAGIGAVLIVMQPPATPHTPAKHDYSSNERPIAERPGTKRPATPFPVGTNQRPPRSMPKTEPLVSRPPNNQTLPVTAVTSDPAAELKRVREALQQRNDDGFQLHINQADYLISTQKPANAAELELDVAHFREVHKLLAQFWQAVRDGADKKIPKGIPIKFRKQEVSLVSREGDQLTYLIDGKQEVSAIKKLPARIAMTIGYKAFGAENLEGKIAMAVFLTIDSDAASDQASQRFASRLLEEIEKSGVTANPVLVRELGKLPKLPAHAEDDFSPPMVGGAGPTTTPDKPFDPKLPAATVEPKKLDPMLVKEAREKFDKQYRERMLEASEKLAPAKTLFTELMEHANKDETVEFKVKLLSQANELAARLGDIDSILATSEKIAALGGENSLDIQLQLFGRLNLDLPGVPKELMRHAQTAATQAQVKGDLFRAGEWLKIAKRAADKAKLTTESQAIQEKLLEVEKARTQGK